MRYSQSRTSKTKGSQRLIQDIVDAHPELLNAHIKEKIKSVSTREICWKSPLQQDEFAEYRDAAFLKLLGLSDLTGKLKEFWPPKGPQWDALGKTLDGKIFFLVEAKANVPELVSFCGAKDKESLKKISAGLEIFSVGSIAASLTWIGNVAFTNMLTDWLICISSRKLLEKKPT